MSALLRLASSQQRRYAVGASWRRAGERRGMNALIGIQNGDNTVTAVECLAGGELAGAGSTLYSCYAARAKAEALVRFGAVRQLAVSLGKTEFVPGALRDRKHKPQRFRNRNEYARAGAARSSSVYLQLKNGDWRMLEGVGTKGNPRWPGLKRLIGGNGLRSPVVTKHDDHDDPDVVARIERLVDASPSTPAPASRPASVPSTPGGSGGAILEPIVIEVV